MENPIIRAICYDYCHFELFANFKVTTFSTKPQLHQKAVGIESIKLARNRGVSLVSIEVFTLRHEAC